ncbi:MAG: Fe-S cluster assembly protein SufD [Chloroflexota bacterium]|nr:Fe-S cluster assembly protein SufD [Chloroflexota bacterium]
MVSSATSVPRLSLSREAVEDLAAERREPEWLRQIRRQAFEAFERMPLPDQHTEGWRRTSLRGLPLEAAAEPGTGVADQTLADMAGARLASVRGGAVTTEGGEVMDLRDALGDPRLAERVQQHLARIVQPEMDKFTALHYALFDAGVLVYLPRGRAVEQPLWITHVDSLRPHTLIILDEGAEARVVEEFTASGALASGAVEQVLGPNAKLRYVNVQRFPTETWSFTTQRAILAQDAHLRTLNAALGARTARNTIQVVLEGRGSQADLLGVVAIGDRQHVDFQTLQDHFGNATRSDLIIHDALRDRASANFTGLIRINKTARQTESSQEQKNILLSDRARADSDPKLEILNNDVIRCTHGAAVGPVDQEMLFYLQSRGLDRAWAEQLIVEGFFRSTLEKLGDERIQEALWAAISA